VRGPRVWPSIRAADQKPVCRPQIAPNLRYVLRGARGAFTVLSRMPTPASLGWVKYLRWALAAMFLVTGSAHWSWLRPDLVRMVPPSLPNPELLVTISGLAEITGAVGLLIPRLAPLAAGGLVLLLVAVFPANVRAAQEGLTLDGHAMPGLVVRTLMQVVLIAVVVVAGFTPAWRRKPYDQHR
jgi:uncharacterized membrane protein